MSAKALGRTGQKPLWVPRASCCVNLGMCGLGEIGAGALEEAWKTQELSSGCFLHRREGNIVIHSQIWMIPALIVLSSHFSRPLLPSDEFLGSVSLVGGIPQAWPPLALSTLLFSAGSGVPQEPWVWPCLVFGL